MANMTAELRKYHVGLILANQFLDQLEPEIRDAVLGNVGTLVSFRVGPKDAPLIAKEFNPTFEPTDLLNLPNYHIYLKLMVDGAPSKAFSGLTTGSEEVFGGTPHRINAMIVDDMVEGPFTCNHGG